MEKRMDTNESTTTLVEEYSALLQGLEHAAPDSIERVLTRDGEWTPEAAAHLLRLAREYGSFMLKSALALSLVLDIEDGELGF
jgi:hypothetical protein